ncbi:MAG: rhodanese-like domain-containing protein [Flavobacteriaceae bacterium]|nr:rhodanese-like domain-containing protein [Flavobacteriaceae bacterium]
MNTNYWLVLLFLSISFSCQPKAQSNVVDVVSVTEFEQRITEPNVQIIDARTAKEYTDGHIENAQNMDVLQIENFRTEIQKLDKEKPVLVYCKSGKRSQKASQILEEEGFTKVIDLKGGYNAWQKNQE